MCCFLGAVAKGLSVAPPLAWTAPYMHAHTHTPTHPAARCMPMCAAKLFMSLEIAASNLARQLSETHVSVPPPANIILLAEIY